MIAFIDEHRGAYGADPIRRVLPARSQSSPQRAAFAAGLRGIAPSTYRAHAARRADPGRLPVWAQSDAALMVELRRGPWRSFAVVKLATLEWVDWFNNRRLLEPIGNVPPAEAEARCCAQAEAQALAA